MPDDPNPMLVAVTGGSRGIGREIVRELAEDGFDVLFTYRTSTDEAADLVGELCENWPNQTFEAHQVDLAERSEVDALTRDLSERDDLYGLIHNAGETCDGLAATIDQDRAERTMQINFWSLTRLVTGAVRPMVRGKGGRIIGIGSMAALHTAPGNAVYAATKGAMLSYLRTVAVELGRKGITANFIAPGYVDTDMVAPYCSYRGQLEMHIPARRFAHASEVAALVRHLMSPAAEYINGSVLPIDGGMNAGISQQYR